MAVIETIIYNKEEIVLDSKDNVFVGPDGYYKIVIDEFDGNNVKAWHFEGPKGEKSTNLATQNEGKHIDALINAYPNSTAKYFYDVFAPARLLNYLPKQ